MAAVCLPPAEYLREALDYDPATGVLTWRARPRSHFPDEATMRKWNTRRGGTQAGDLRKEIIRYKLRRVWRIAINNRRYLSHRVVWKIVTGEEPPATLDHRDQDPTNNKWDNLRPATRSQQGMNKSRMANNKSGFRGVTLKKSTGKWSAQICVNGKTTHLGYYHSIRDAKAAYESASKQLFGEFWTDRKARRPN